MTYFGILLIFIGPPLLLLISVMVSDLRRGIIIPAHFRTLPLYISLLAHVTIAVLYTTPWDNYLVAKEVWWYEPDLVSGIVLGWVPIEEYIFFVVQTLMSGMWLFFLMRRIPAPPHIFRTNKKLRLITAIIVGILWLIWLLYLLVGWNVELYMALLLVWALPPIILQLIFGADILWHYRKLVLPGVMMPFLYLCFVDAFAISREIWTINPDSTFGVDLFGMLPLEEILFFLLTNVLIIFGITLMQARETHLRIGRKNV